MDANPVYAHANTPQPRLLVANPVDVGYELAHIVKAHKRESPGGLKGWSEGQTSHGHESEPIPDAVSAPAHARSARSFA